MPDEIPWTNTIHTYRAVVGERFNEDNGFALRKRYHPRKVDWQNLPRYNSAQGPHGAQKVNLRRAITYFDAKAGWTVNRNKSLRISRDTEIVPVAEAKNWLLERGDLQEVQLPGSGTQTNSKPDTTIEESLQSLTISD